MGVKVRGRVDGLKSGTLLGGAARELEADFILLCQAISQEPRV